MMSVVLARSNRSICVAPTDTDTIRSLEETAPGGNTTKAVVNENERAMAFANTGNVANHIVGLEVAGE